MGKQLGFNTSLVLLLATAALWVGCSQNRVDSNYRTKTNSPQSSVMIQNDPSSQNADQSFQFSNNDGNQGPSYSSMNKPPIFMSNQERSGNQPENGYYPSDQGFGNNSFVSPQGHPGISYAPPQGYGNNSYDPSSQGRPDISYTPPQGYSDNSYDPSQGNPDNSYSPTQGFGDNPYDPSQGRPDNSYSPVQGFGNNSYDPSQGRSDNSYSSPQGYNDNSFAPSSQGRSDMSYAPVSSPVGCDCTPSCPMIQSDPCTPYETSCDTTCKPKARCHYPSSNQLCCRDGITVTARNPHMCMLGDDYPMEFDIQACDDVCDVKVTAHFPDGVTFIRSVPEANVQGRQIVWDIGGMKKGECRPAKVWLRCECEGELCACFCATASPVRFCSLLCAKPLLVCHKCGPDEVCPGGLLNYTISVTNRGSCAAEDVVVTDQVPDGLSHSSCLRTLTYRLGNLEPCQTKRVNICMTAEKRGKVCNTAVVSSCNADSVSCQWCTNVCLTCLELTKCGPKEQTIGKNADYQITVQNTGDKTLTDLIITDLAPPSTSIVAACGATINGNQAVWRVRELLPNEKICYTITLTTCVPGCYTNFVNVATCQGCRGEACYTTHWKGRPALNVQICDTEDPICIGETTSYCITILNQGSEADSNVVLTAQFPVEIVPLCASGDTVGRVSCQTVIFAPALSLPPHSALKYRIDARAVQSGDARVHINVSSDSIKTPITQQESTIVN
jgi:uncharacterized repeat protein (TIGR01451 family)